MTFSERFPKVALPSLATQVCPEVFTGLDRVELVTETCIISVFIEKGCEMGNAAHNGLLWLPQQIMKQGFEQNAVFWRLSQEHQIGVVVHI
jgi:hypothetical protein